MTEIETNAVESVIPDGEGDNEFKQCDQISFYRRQKQGNRQQYHILLNTLVLTEKGAVMELLDRNTEAQLVLQVCAIRGGAIRLLVDELKPIRPRYKVPDVLTREPVYERLHLDKKEENSVTLGWGVSRYQVRIQACPLLLEVLCEGEVTVTLNQNGRLYFEVLQDPPAMRPLTSVDEEEDPTGLWREKFKHFVDIKGSGPSSVGVDLRLCGFSHLYGLPEHADTFQLKDTSDGEPYRLYNLDVFGYDIHSRLGLYGSVPLVLAHNTSRTIGVFWLNASETLVDLQCISDGVPSSDLQGFTPPPAKRRYLQPHTDLTWMSESGVIDSFILLGPGPPQVFSQYAELTGYQAMPPLFSLGYHQCRWNYENEADVKEVDAGFDSHAIPYDVMWLDIEHTNEKRYFTWDPRRFPNPICLQRHLEERNRKLVVISDPHIKVDPAWSIYCEARKSGHFVRDREGGPFCGRCWPGASCYLDFSSSTVRTWYSCLFALEKYKGSTENMFIWNDMNEPSVFDGPEKTMPKDAVHYGGVEHRELHNLYGFYQHMATVDGLISRSHGLDRPFVLSRSFFAGSQRLGAIWTGDNMATWEYLKISIPMLLALSVAGIAFCGADVGGFFRDPEPELLVRWYQAGSLQPFFRGHSCRETKRREPWLFGDPFTAAIRAAVQQRYCLLPYWYTLFYEAHTSAQPPMRPLWVEFPGEQDTFSVENQYMIGNALLACPVADPGVTEVKVVLPGSSEYWYDVQTNVIFAGGKTLSLPVTLDTVPLFQRGGTIVPRKTESGSCSADLQKVPFTLTVALDSKACAMGQLFLDDGHSFSYQDRKQYSLRRFSLQGGRLVCCSADDAGLFDPGCTVSSVSFLGVKNKPSAVTTRISGVEEICKSVQYQGEKHLLLVGDLNLNVGKDWEIKIQ
ncbi:neutral alpha-glucosidase C isoform X1 [Brienomyrus brachyistius]|uniref:neutral alpha-glucosidase C isoform X1 n=1 Tax=Brienomyrus brachyistius TaxID=42636 RepID=UPI0020B274E6|nr:neutral alpha-glucosidase C isoform X1 [Brienomyrus brachyistius]XP_048830318.1 neutral alpha-glucosidase C isoform X1 [Brienomyrus brachyistius]